MKPRFPALPNPPQADYEFGSKVSLAITKNTNLIVSAVDFSGNPHDSKTLEATLNQHQKLTGSRAKAAIVDRGYAGKKSLTKPKSSCPRAEKTKPLTKKQKRENDFVAEPPLSRASVI